MPALRRLLANGTLVLGALLLALAVGALAVAPREVAAGPDCSADGSIDGEEQEMLRLINQHRKANGKAPLEFSDTLNSAAAWKSQHLADNSYFAHDDTPIGRSWVDRLRDCGYTYNTWLGENIAAGNATAAATFEQWRNSSGHNANMLSSNYAAIGIGRAYNASSPYGWYWTTDFGGVADGYTEPDAAYRCADLDGDGIVLIADILLIIQRFGTSDAAADLDGDGSVRIADILVAVSQYRDTCTN